MDKESGSVKESKSTIVPDPETGKIYYVKKLKIYDLRVYDHLCKTKSPYTANIESYYEENGVLTVNEECIHGITLEKHLEENKDLSFKERKDLLLKICKCVKFLHSSTPTIIHRDIKGSNIMVEDNGNVRLIDYDAAIVLKESGERDTNLLGTAGSAAPEQYGFRTSDERTDIYALGVLIREMFPDSRKMQKIAQKATQMDPDKRYRGVNMLTDRLRGFAVNIIRVPGFRTKKVWKAVISVITFTAILLFSLTYRQPETLPVWAGISERISYIVLGLILTDLYFGWTHIYNHLPLIRARKINLRVIGYIIWTAVVIAAWSLFISIIHSAAGV